jgi:hypothetical protein
VAGDGIGPGTAAGSTPTALLPGHHEPTPILRLRYQGSADRWAIGIYLASRGQYPSRIAASFGPKTGTPEQEVDDTFVLMRAPKPAVYGAQPASGTPSRPQKARSTR